MNFEEIHYAEEWSMPEQNQENVYIPDRDSITINQYYVQPRGTYEDMNDWF